MRAPVWMLVVAAVGGAAVMTACGRVPQTSAPTTRPGGAVVAPSTAPPVPPTTTTTGPPPLPLGRSVQLRTSSPDVSAQVTVTRVWSDPVVVPLANDGPGTGIAPPVPAGTRWVGVSVSLLNTGAEHWSADNRDDADVAYTVDGSPPGPPMSTLTTAGLSYGVRGCPEVDWTILATGTGVTGCVALPVPTTATVTSVGVVVTVGGYPGSSVAVWSVAPSLTP